MDLTAAAAPAVLDAGTVTFDVRAFLAGFGTQSDHARIEVTFADGSGAPVGGIATTLDGGIEIDPGPPQALVHDNPLTFVGFVDPSVDPFNGNDRYTAWKEYRDVAGVPVGSRTARVTIFEDSHGTNGNDDYVDLVSFDVVDTGIEQFLKIEVNKTTGSISFKNESATELDINFYEITSDAGLLSNGWDSLADQLVDSQGPNAEDNWREGGGSSSQLLTEAFLHSSNIAVSETITMANGYTGGNGGGEDLKFLYGLSDGRLIAGIVNYVIPVTLAGLATSIRTPTLMAKISCCCSVDFLGPSTLQISTIGKRTTEPVSPAARPQQAFPNQAESCWFPLDWGSSLGRAVVAAA